MSSRYPLPTAMVQRVQERIGEWLMRSYPVKDLPLKIRPAMIFITAGWLIILGILGMAPIPSIPINDKALHFFGLGFATFLLYFIIDVPEGPGRRVWYFRRAPLLLTLVTSFFFGCIVSEFIQGMLPVELILQQWKEFQFGDIVANLLGSTLFLYLAHLLSTRARKRSELSTLYQPLSDSSTYRDAMGREHTFGRDTESQPPRERGRARQGSNVWDEDSEDGLDVGGERAAPAPIFDIGDNEEDEASQSRRQNTLV